VLDAVDAYRAAFRPSEDLTRPYISVSADVVVADDDDTAKRLASGYGLWVRSIRTGAGAIAFPSPEAADAHEWNDEDLALVKDRIDTQLVGSPQTVADKLEQLQRATGADELAVTTITHRHADRVRSYELLAQEWERRQN
jgi:alkanesulfonate monooxygenase SsuD/methylene tetrahydromethanopterin reductase-like flavin-dependent oxidoreductase (luciferase family)